MRNELTANTALHDAAEARKQAAARMVSFSKPALKRASRNWLVRLFFGA